MSAEWQHGLTRRKALWAMGFAIAAGLFCLCLGILIPNAREAARRSACKNNLKQIGLALHNYHDVHGCFPPAITYGPDGKPWHSWRVLIHPFLVASDFYEQYQFDEPWDGPNNRKLMARTGCYGWLYQCPSDDSDRSHTSYLAIIGDGTMWPTDGVATFGDVAGREDEIIQIVEVAGSGIHWMEPRDLSFDTMSFAINGEDESIESRHGSTANVAFVDGHVEPITASTPPDELRSMLLWNADDE